MRASRRRRDDELVSSLSARDLAAARRPTTGPGGARMRHPSGRPMAPARRRGGPAFLPLLTLIVVLNLIGLLMVLSASSVQALQTSGSQWAVFVKQVMWVTLGGVGFVVAMRMPYQRWTRFSGLALGASFVLLALVLVPGMGITVNGSTRWLEIGFARLQPSELAKFGLLLFSCDLLSRRAGWIADTRVTMRPLLVIFAVMGSMMLLQPDLGTTIIVGAILFSVLFVAGTPLVPLGGLGSLATGAAVLLAISADYRRERLTAFLDPWADPLNTGYHTLQSMVGIASGGLFGVGLGASRAKWGFLPNAHTDFIFAIISEELGLFGSLVVIGLFVALGVFGVRAARSAPDGFGLLMASGITAWFMVQAIINIGGVVGAMPVTGVPLPFISFGGSSMLVTMVAAGILVNIARQGR